MVAAAVPAAPAAKSKPWLIGAAILAVVAVAAVLAVWLRAPLPPPRLLSSKQITSDSLPKGLMVTDGTRIYFTEVISTGDRIRPGIQ